MEKALDEKYKEDFYYQLAAESKGELKALLDSFKRKEMSQEIIIYFLIKERKVNKKIQEQIESLKVQSKDFQFKNIQLENEIIEVKKEH